jgi:LysR family transcriptional regulator, hydrogen peroxide-inducible genes activator
VITTRQLCYLDALARHQHFGRAAAECCVSQPALSMQIHELEGLLGTELIERRPGAPMFTELGVEIAKRAGAILGAVRDLTDLAQHRAKVLSGTLRLDLVEAQTKVLVADLERGALDVLLLALPLKTAAVEVFDLVRDYFLFAVPTDDPLPETTRVTSCEVKKRNSFCWKKATFCGIRRSTIVPKGVGMWPRASVQRALQRSCRWWRAGMAPR